MDQADIELARRVSPEQFLRRYYADVTTNRHGDSISVDRVMRADFKKDHWVSCCWHSGGIGDNINLVRWVLGDQVKFADCVGEILGRVHAVAATPLSPTAPRDVSNNGRPRLPRCSGEQRGRAYLASRGINSATIRHAEACGALSYLSDGVVFLGRDWQQKEVRLATIRYYEPIVLPSGKLGTKRDIANSDKAFPMLLTGDKSLVIIVEGGVNALAAWQMRKELDGTPPISIATGGVGIQSWLTENAFLHGIISTAGAVEIWGENETDAFGNSNPEKQERTDQQRLKLQAAVAAMRQGELPDIIYPPAGCKDAADCLQDSTVVESVVGMSMG